MGQIDWRGEDLHFTDEGSGPTVMFLHGLGGSANNWLHQRRSLSIRRRVLTMDLPGHGRSTGSGVRFDQYAEAAYAVLDHTDAVDVTVVGLAMGARVGITLAHRAPDRVGRLAFVNAYLTLPPDECARRVELYNLLLQPDGVETWGARLLDGMGIPASSSVGRRFLRSLAQLDPAHINSVFHQVNGVDQRAELCQLDLPIHIMVGERDRLVPAVSTKELQRLSQRSTTHRFAGSGHLPYLEEPQAFNVALDAFIDS